MFNLSQSSCLIDLHKQGQLLKERDVSLHGTLGLAYTPEGAGCANANEFQEDCGLAKQCWKYIMTNVVHCLNSWVKVHKG
jgi:hypothetical protein